MNPVLKIALQVSNGATIYANRNEVVTKEWIEQTPNSKLFNSLYFSKNGLEYRISNHELPERRYMEATSFATLDIAIERGFGSKLFHKNNIEVIVKNGEIEKTNLNFNIN